MITKKGLSQYGKEALYIARDFLLPPHFFHIVHPLCWNELDEKNKFPIKQSPFYPLFYRDLQEPLAIAMSLSTTEAVFGKESEEFQIIREFILSLSKN